MGLKLNDRLILMSEVNDASCSVDFNLKFLSNKLRSDILNLDNKYAKIYSKDVKNAKVADAQNELKTLIQNIESSLTLTNEEKKSEINIAMTKFALDSEESFLDENCEFTKKVYSIADCKVIDTLKLIANKDTIEDPEKLFFSENDSEFWQNADIGFAEEIIDFFRKSYKIGR